MRIRMPARILAVSALVAVLSTLAVVLPQPTHAQVGGQVPSLSDPSQAPGPSGPASPGPGASGPGSTGPGPSPSSLWGAIAFTSDGSHATVWKAPSKAEAEANVAKRCARLGH